MLFGTSTTSTAALCDDDIPAFGECEVIDAIVESINALDSKGVVAIGTNLGVGGPGIVCVPTQSVRILEAIIARMASGLGAHKIPNLEIRGLGVRTMPRDVYRIAINTLVLRDCTGLTAWGDDIPVFDLNTGRFHDTLVSLEIYNCPSLTTLPTCNYHTLSSLKAIVLSNAPIGGRAFNATGIPSGLRGVTRMVLYKTHLHSLWDLRHCAALESISAETRVLGGRGGGTFATPHGAPVGPLGGPAAEYVRHLSQIPDLVRGAENALRILSEELESGDMAYASARVLAVVCPVHTRLANYAHYLLVRMHMAPSDSRFLDKFSRVLNLLTELTTNLAVIYGKLARVIVTRTNGSAAVNTMFMKSSTFMGNVPKYNPYESDAGFGHPPFSKAAIRFGMLAARAIKISMTALGGIEKRTLCAVLFAHHLNIVAEMLLCMTSQLAEDRANSLNKVAGKRRRTERVEFGTGGDRCVRGKPHTSRPTPSMGAPLPSPLIGDIPPLLHSQSTC